MSNLSDKKSLNELHLNLLGKVMLASIGAWMIGKMTNVKLRGTPQQVRAVANALASSKKFQDELQKAGGSVERVMDKLKVKNMHAQEFERIFQVRWPL